MPNYFRRAFTRVELPARSHRQRKAFTMVELLVVIGILVLLVSILLPAISKAYDEARRTSDAADLAAISQGLDAYRNDFGDYPRIDTTLVLNQSQYPGSVLLCWALIAPGPQGNGGGTPFGSDGYGDPTGSNLNLPGPGFRVRGTQGAVHQPYVNVDRFKMGVVATSGTVTPATTTTAFNDSTTVILDRFSQPILYFAGNKQAAVTAAAIGSYVGQGAYPGGPVPVNPALNPRYNSNDAPINQLFSYSIGNSPLTPIKAMLRLMPGVNTDPSGNQTLDPSAATSANYLLWSAGPDGKFGGNDDVTNFR